MVMVLVVWWLLWWWWWWGGGGWSGWSGWWGWWWWWSFWCDDDKDNDNDDGGFTVRSRPRIWCKPSASPNLFLLLSLLAGILPNPALAFLPAPPFKDSWGHSLCNLDCIKLCQGLKIYKQAWAFAWEPGCWNASWRPNLRDVVRTKRVVVAPGSKPTIKARCIQGTGRLRDRRRS